MWSRGVGINDVVSRSQAVKAVGLQIDDGKVEKARPRVNKTSR